MFVDPLNHRFHALHTGVIKAMTKSPSVDEFCDEWEQRRESNPRLSLDQFIAERMKRVDDQVIREFRKLAEELAAFDDRLAKFGGPKSTVIRTPKWNASNARPNTLQPGSQPIPGYVLVSLLGEGGFGEVWKAKAPGGMHVALKFVRVGGRIGEAEQRALEVMKDVRHPHLISVFGTWQLGNRLVIAMELADQTLLDRLHEVLEAGLPGIPKEELHIYMAEAAKGIDFLNDSSRSGRKQIQHRDIKPQNLLLSGGSVKVGDFGLARSMNYDVTSHTGSLTVAYAAPECFDGTTSSRSDQYSLAVTYCHLRGGKLPFDGTPFVIMEGHRKGKPNLSMVPFEERSAVTKALAKRPSSRWSSCREFVNELSAAGVSPPSMSTEWLHEIRRIIRFRSLSWTRGGIVAVSVLLICLAFWFFDGDRETEENVASVTKTSKSTPRHQSVTTLVPPRDLNAILRDFPLPFVKYDVINTPARFSNSPAKLSLVARIENAEYQRLIQQLNSELGRLANESGDGLLGLPAKNARVDDGIFRYGDLSSLALADAIHRSVGYQFRSRPQPEGFLILIAEEFLQTPWGEQDDDSTRKLRGGSQVLRVKWFWVSEATAKPVAMAFRRARLVEIQVTNGAARLPLIRPISDVRERISQGTSYLPGGPAGMIFSSGMGGGNLTLMGARNFYEGTFRNRASVPLESIPLMEQERVLLLMPGFLVDGFFEERVTITDLSFPTSSTPSALQGTRVHPRIPSP